MKALTRLLIVAMLLACFSLTASSKSQAKSNSPPVVTVFEPQNFAPAFDQAAFDRIASLESRVAAQDAKIAELEGKLAKMVDPILQAPQRTTVAVGPPMIQSARTLKTLANGQIVECNETGCRVITSGPTVGGIVTSTYGESGNCTSIEVDNRFMSRGPVRRFIAGR